LANKTIILLLLSVLLVQQALAFAGDTFGGHRGCGAAAARNATAASHQQPSMTGVATMPGMSDTGHGHDGGYSDQAGDADHVNSAPAAPPADCCGFLGSHQCAMLLCGVAITSPPAFSSPVARVIAFFSLPSLYTNAPVALVDRPPILSSRTATS